MMFPLATALTALKPYYRRLMGTAERLLQRGELAPAAIMAFTACEVLTEQAFDELWRARQIPELAGPVGKVLSSHNMANERVRDVYNALSGDRIEAQHFWPAFVTFAKLRNRLAHGTERQPSRELVEAGLKAAAQFQAHLVRRLYPYHNPHSN